MKVRFHRKFNKDFRRCPLKIQEQFRKRFNLFLEDPHHPLLENHALHGEWNGFRSINITGDYRALYKSPDGETMIFIVLDTYGNLYE